MSTVIDISVLRANIATDKTLKPVNEDNYTLSCAHPIHLKSYSTTVVGTITITMIHVTPVVDLHQDRKRH